MLGDLISSRAGRISLVVLGFLLLGVIGVLDYVTGWELSLTALYLGPISLIAWIGGFWPAGAAALVAALIWALADAAAGHAYSQAIIGPWNSLMRFAHFALVGFTLAALKAALARERLHARHDFLTGIPNGRYFFELAALCVERDRRDEAPTTVAYLDCDNFKIVNDVSGHATGDEALKVIAGTITRTVRVTDVVARIGGDEFAVLLSSTGHAEAHEVLSRIVENLAHAMRQRTWPISCSVGAVTFDRAPSMDAAVQQAEGLMRQAKARGKDQMIHIAVRGVGRSEAAMDLRQTAGEMSSVLWGGAEAGITGPDTDRLP